MIRGIVSSKNHFFLRSFESFLNDKVTITYVANSLSSLDISESVVRREEGKEGKRERKGELISEIIY